MKKYLTDEFPNLCKEWDYDKNAGLDVNKITLGSGLKVFWKCLAGHSYLSKIEKRVKGQNCPYCSNRKISLENSLLVTHPKLCLEWNYKKNNTLRPENFSQGSNKKVWWKCLKRHEYQCIIQNRTKNKSNCPYCSGREINSENCFSTTNPELCKEWDHEKNGNIKPDNITYGSNTKVNWICSKGHSYESTIKSRSTNNTNCPYCCNQKVNSENCLLTTHLDLCKEWDYEKNILKPEDITPGYNKNIWWKCSKNHSFQSIVKDRTSKSVGCPYCSGHKVNSENCFSTTHPELCKEWNYNKNILKPEDITYGNTLKLWWICPNKHSYQASCNQRTSGNTGCPYCLYKTQEKCREIFEKIFHTKFIMYSPKWLGKLQLDGYNENLKLAWEYDGEFHFRKHFKASSDKSLMKQKERDKKKEILCKENGITLIRIPYTEKNNLENYIKEVLFNNLLI